MEILKKCIDNITPKVEMKARRIGGATYQIPIEISERRGKSLAIQILIKKILNLKSSKQIMKSD